MATGFNQKDFEVSVRVCFPQRIKLFALYFLVQHFVSNAAADKIAM